MRLYKKEGTLSVLTVCCGDYVDLGRYLVIAVLFHFLCRQSYVNFKKINKKSFKARPDGERIRRIYRLNLTKVADILFFTF